MIAVLMIVPAALFIICLLPEKKQTTEIISGICFEETDTHTDIMEAYLTDNSTGFEFRIYDDSSIMQNDVASGKIDSGYMIPYNFTETFIKETDNPVVIYTTPGSSFVSVTSESVYAAILMAYASDISADTITRKYPVGSATGYSHEDIDNYINEHFMGYMADKDIFTIKTSLSGKYIATNEIVPNNFPVHGLVYIIIFICALLGLQNYLKDLRDGVYAMLPSGGRNTFCIKNIAAGIIPAAILSLVSLSIYDGLRQLGQTLICICLACIICFILTSILRIVFRSYKVFSIALPFIIICTLLLCLLSTL